MCPDYGVAIAISHNYFEFVRFDPIVVAIDCDKADFAGKLKLAVIPVQDNGIAIAMTFD